MKRIALFCMLTALFCAICPACAWEVSPEHEALAASLLPGYALLDAQRDGDRDVLLVTTPEGETRLAFCCARLFAGLSAPLPEALFRIADSYLYADTAMLLMEDIEGTAYFVGCVRDEEGWQTVVSTPLPAGMQMTAGESGFCLDWTRRTAFGGGSYTIRFIINLQADGRWMIMETDNSTVSSSMRSRIHYYFESVRTEVQCLHGEQLFSRDVTQVLWQTFPTTMEAVAEQMDLSDWAILAENAALLDAPGGAALAQMNPGAHLYILGYGDGWVEVAPSGSAVSGWLPAEALLIGSRQPEGEYLAPDCCPVVNRYANALDVYLYPSDAADTPLLVHLNRQEAYPVYAMGVWGDGSWTMLYDHSIPGGVGFVRTEQLEAEPVGGLG